MKIFKDSFKIFKKNFFTLAIAQLMLFFFSLFFLVYVKGKLESYLLQIQQFQLPMQKILGGLNSADPTAILQSQTLIESMTKVTDQAMLFAFVVVPVVLLLLWILFQGIFWKRIKEHKIKNLRHYFIKLSIPTIVILGITIMYTTKKRNIVDFFSTFDINIAKIALATFIALYLLTTYYAVLNNQKFLKSIKTTLSLSIKKFYKYIPLYIPLYLNSMLLIFLLMITLTQQVSQSTFYIEIMPLILIVLISLGFSTYYKILFQKTVEKDIS